MKKKRGESTVSIRQLSRCRIETAGYIYRARSSFNWMAIPRDALTRSLKKLFCPAAVSVSGAVFKREENLWPLIEGSGPRLRGN